MGKDGSAGYVCENIHIMLYIFKKLKDAAAR